MSHRDPSQVTKRPPQREQAAAETSSTVSRRSVLERLLEKLAGSSPMVSSLHRSGPTKDDSTLKGAEPMPDARTAKTPTWKRSWPTLLRPRKPIRSRLFVWKFSDVPIDFAHRGHLFAGEGDSTDEAITGNLCSVNQNLDMAPEYRRSGMTR